MFYASCLSPQKNHLFTHHKNAPCNWLSAHKTRGRARRMCSWPRHGIFKCKFNGDSLSGWHLMALLVDSKISPTYPWKIPRMFHQQLMKEFLPLWGFGEVWGIFPGYVGKVIDWWLTQPNWKKYAPQNGFIFPKGENKTYLSCHHQSSY